MIISKSASVRITSRNITRYRKLGYEIEKISYDEIGNLIDRYIDVKLEHLSVGSHAIIEHRCNDCSKTFYRKFNCVVKYKDFCDSCIRTIKIVESRRNGVGYNTSNSSKGVPRPQQSGPRNGRWNPNKSKFNTYNGKIRKLTKRNKIVWGEWENADKIGKMGVKGAYQLDHKISVKYGFDNHIVPDLIADIKNLQIIPWEENRNKGSKNSCDLWDILI